MKKHFTLAGLAMLSLFSLMVKAQSTFSDFSSGKEGWVIIGSNATYSPGFSAAGGNPGGYIYAYYDSIPEAKWVYSAPSGFTGNKIGAYNHSLSFDLMLLVNDVQFNDPDVILTGGGYQLVYDLKTDTINGWQSYTLILNENAGWHVTDLNGIAPTADIMKAVLTNLEHLQIRGKYSSTGLSSALDNVYLSMSQSFSTFDTDYEGWRIFGDAQGGTGMPNYHSTGGHPGGYLSAVDDVTGGTWYWQAPGKFLGNMSSVYGQNLRFEIKQSGLNDQYDNYDVVLQGPSFNLVYNTPNNPDTTWTGYSIVMSENAGWHRDDTLGPVPSHAEFMEVISNLQMLLIRGEFISGPDSGCLDNVSLGSILGIPVCDNPPRDQMTIYPNPASDKAIARFYVRQSGYYTISIINGQGEICRGQKIVFCSNGVQEIALPINAMPSGIYTCIISNPLQTFTGRLIIVQRE